MTRALALVLMLATAAAAAPTPAPDPVFPCWPTGVPTDIQTWPVVRAVPLELAGEEGPVEVAGVVYQRGPRKILLGWREGRLVLADLEPDNRTAPFLVNDREFSPPPANELKTGPAGPCRWRPAIEERT